MTRPVDPNISIPSAFAINGTKTDFTNEKIQDGFDDTNPDILAGDNLNKFIDDTYKGLNYAMDGVEDLYDVTDDLKDLSNLSASGQAILDNKANKDLSNLSATGEAHFANHDLSNLSNKGNNRLHALKGYLDDGELLTDAEGLADVVNYAHSTFDLSKFTVTGTPTITDDGIASGFVSSTNFLNATYTSTTPTTSVDIWTKVIITEVTETSGVYWAIDGNLRLMRSSATAIGLRGFSGALSCDVTGLSLALNDEVIIHANVTGTNATVDVWINGVKSSNSVTHSNTIESAYSHLVVGGQYSNGNYSPKNSIDLKYQRVLFDGVEVFSGNKTGLDVIKPDNYTIVGAPTISADGIASGFSSSKYLMTTNIIDFNSASNWEITLNIKIGTATQVETFYSGNTAWQGLRIYTEFSKLHVVFASQTGSYNIGDINFPISNSTNYSIKVVFTGNKYIVYSNNEVISEIVSDLKILNARGLFGVNFGTSRPATTGSIDLNSFKIYIDGNLVYQPCLKIPYTESKTGSKVVDSQYRDRVQDAYNDQGYAPYYTLDEANGNFTLPQGEIYGMINRLQENSNREIGLPIVTLSNTLNDNEIWLEGAEVSKTAYAKLYAVYGDNWGTPANNSNFVLPDFRNKTIWGVDANAGWGYISAGLPNITGNIVNNPVFQYPNDDSNGAFRTTNLGLATVTGSGDGFQIKSISFDASRSSGIYGNSNTVQPPSTKVRFKTRFE